MPTYQYECEACQYQLEEFQSITAAPLVKCPKCSEEKLRRRVGGGLATLRFTGSGFYITDYAKKGESGGSCGCGKPPGESCSAPTKGSDE